MAINNVILTGYINSDIERKTTSKENQMVYFYTKSDNAVIPCVIIGIKAQSFYDDAEPGQAIEVVGSLGKINNELCVFINEIKLPTAQKKNILSSSAQSSVVDSLKKQVEFESVVSDFTKRYTDITLEANKVIESIAKLDVRESQNIDFAKVRGMGTSEFTKLLTRLCDIDRDKGKLVLKPISNLDRYIARMIENEFYKKQ